MRAVVITGASTGIGFAAAKLLTQKEIRVFGSVRKKEDGERLIRELGTLFSPLYFDITDIAAVQYAAKEVEGYLAGNKLFGLVNNAGIAVSGPLLHITPQEFRNQLDVNLTGQLITTQAFAPLLGANRSFKGEPGRIINIGSVSGKMAMPFMGPYAISKHGIEAFSESLRRELMIYGIDVIIVAPGAVTTPIYDKGLAKDISALSQTDYAESIEKFKEFAADRWAKALSPDAVAEVIYEALTTRHPKVRYALVKNKCKNWILPRLLPKRVLDRSIAKMLGLQQ